METTSTKTASPAAKGQNKTVSISKPSASSKEITVKITFHKKMYFEEEVQLTQKQYEQLKKFDGTRFEECENRKAFSLLQEIIDTDDIMDLDEALHNFEITDDLERESQF